MNANVDAPAEAGITAESASLASVSELRLRRILCATDFSECSRKALRYGISFARQFNAEILIVHVYEPAPPQVGVLEGALVETSLYEDLAGQLEQWRREVAPAVTAKAIMRQGAAAREIVATAEENNIDLLVVGNHGRRGLARAVLGSTAEKVVRLAPCPVLVVRDHEHEFIKV
jgi:nucleotide-binding universal stress UspA family protein